MSTALLPKLLRTPMSRLVRGKIGPEATSTSLLEESALPGEAKALIARVVKKTRLWAREKREVAEELADHFSAALEGGGSVEEAVAAFGDADKAAKLIRRGKMRNRPLWWRTWRHGRNLAGGLLLAYAGMVTAFVMGQPKVTVDYVARYNAPALATPADKRGWTYYDRALDLLPAELRKPYERNKQRVAWDAMVDSEPGHRSWGELVAFLAGHGEAMRLAREGAEQESAAHVADAATGVSDPMDLGMVSMSLSWVAEMRDLADLLGADARVARANVDAPRFVADVRALMGMGHQMSGRGLLTQQLFGMAVENVAIDAVDRALADGSPKLNGDELAALGHLLGKGRIHIDLTAEREVFYDCVQRIYTDNGRGDGYVSLRGAKNLAWAWAIESNPSNPQAEPGDGAAEALILNGAPLTMASRRETLAEFDRLMGVAERNLAQPRREVDWDQVEGGLAKLVATPMGNVRHAVLRRLFPSLATMGDNQERLNGQLEGTMAALACEAYRLEVGHYPEKLADLVPTFLPAVPVDRIDGQPLRYRLAGGKPLIYSVGSDRVDDGGKAATDAKGHHNWWIAADWRPAGASGVKGDWVLYPKPEVIGVPQDPSNLLNDPDGK